MNLRLTALVVILALAAGACGMRGPLYLPEQEPAAVPGTPGEPAQEAPEGDEEDEGKDEEAAR
jgi:predicted small lipoprotein YifL